MIRASADDAIVTVDVLIQMFYQKVGAHPDPPCSSIYGHFYMFAQNVTILNGTKKSGKNLEKFWYKLKLWHFTRPYVITNRGGSRIFMVGGSEMACVRTAWFAQRHANVSSPLVGPLPHCFLGLVGCIPSIPPLDPPLITKTYCELNGRFHNWYWCFELSCLCCIGIIQGLYKCNELKDLIALICSD